MRLLMDARFRQWRSDLVRVPDGRRLIQEVVPEHLWVTHETSAVPGAKMRDFVSVCSHAQLPRGRLLIERSVEHEEWPQQSDAARAWRFLGVLVQQITSANVSDEASMLEVTTVLQLDLSLHERLTSEFALESSELIQAIQA